MTPQIVGFLDRIAAVASEAEVARSALDFGRSLGMSGGNIWFADGVAQSHTVNSVVTDLPDWHVERQYEPDIFGKCLLPEIVARSLRPVRHGVDVDRLRFKKGSPDLEMAELAHSELGVRNGIIFPIPVPGRSGSSGMTFFTMDARPAFEKLLNDHIATMGYAAHAAHLRMQQLRSEGAATKGAPLSARERECLCWLAQGLRVKAIAHKLDLREVTVNLHLSNARAKLSAVTNPEAVLRAVQTGDIPL